MVGELVGALGEVDGADGVVVEAGVSTGAGTDTGTGAGGVIGVVGGVTGTGGATGSMGGHKPTESSAVPLEKTVVEPH